MCSYYSSGFTGEGVWRMNRQAYYVYILGNRFGVLYTGVTNDLRRRVWEHRQGQGGAFSRRYETRRLLYFEECPDILSALEREKQIKGYSRRKKLKLIRSTNPTFRDLWSDIA